MANYEILQLTIGVTARATCTGVQVFEAMANYEILQLTIGVTARATYRCTGI